MGNSNVHQDSRLNSTWLGHARTFNAHFDSSLRGIGMQHVLWGFPEMGVPPNHPCIDGFSLINEAFWATPMSMEPPYSMPCMPYMLPYGQQRVQDHFLHRGERSFSARQVARF